MGMYVEANSQKILTLGVGGGVTGIGTEGLSATIGLAVGWSNMKEKENIRVVVDGNVCRSK